MMLMFTKCPVQSASQVFRLFPMGLLVIIVVLFWFEIWFDSFLFGYGRPEVLEINLKV